MAGYATDTIYLHGKGYPCRMLADGDRMVSVDSLDEALFDKNGEYISDRAREVDEAIFFYVPDDVIGTATDNELLEYVENCL